MFANLRGIGRKERPAQLAATKHLFDAIAPDFSTRLQPIKNILHARVQSRLPLAKQTARVVDQQQVTAQMSVNFDGTIDHAAREIVEFHLRALRVRRDDGSPGTCNGVFCIDFHRESSSLEAAINSAMQDVRDAGHENEFMV